jgi:hypothetical protein
MVLHASVMEAPEDIKELMSMSNIALQTFCRIVAEGQKTGEIRGGDPQEMTIAFFAAIQGIALYKLSMEDFKMPDPEILVNMLKKV